jgi:hypothetical protein
VHLKSTSRKRRSALLALVAGTTIAALVAATVPTYSLNTHRTGHLGRRGFPVHYTDNSGVQVKLCEDGTVRCQQAERRDLAPPEGEGFYWMATAKVRSSLGPIDVEFALEAAFGGPRGGRPIVFDRIRIRGHLREAGRYILDHPYGSTAFRAITPEEQRNVDVTHDHFCSIERNGSCDGRIDSFLRSTNPPKGFVGFGGRRTEVTGGTFRNSLVLKTSGGSVLGSTDRFAVLGDRIHRRR